MRIESHLAYLLHRRKYRETSLILDILSSEHGRVSALLRGAYGKGRSQKPVPDVFKGYEIGWVGKGELPVVTSIEAHENIYTLSDKHLYCGFYINELLVRLLGRSDPNAELFSLYEHSLASLAAKSAIEPTLRQFELKLLDYCGYGLVLDVTVDSGEAINAGTTYYYEIETGPVTVRRSEHAIEVSGAALLGLSSGNVLSPQEATEAKSLMRKTIDFYVGDRPLAARSLFTQSTL